jgi:hypothetical protein
MPWEAIEHRATFGTMPIVLFHETKTVNTKNHFLAFIVHFDCHALHQIKSCQVVRLA